MSGKSWRNEIDAIDYFGHQRKSLDIEQRRPVIRRAADLVGPGINAEAIKVTDWNDLLASFNGYYASLPGALNAPNSVENFTGFTVSDSTIGGTQTVTGMASGVQYKRSFMRSAGDPTDFISVSFSPWIGQAQQFGGVTQTMVGPWLVGQPGSLTGTPFTTPAGVLRAVGSCSAFSASQTGLNVQMFLDGVGKSAMYLGSTHPVNTRATLASASFTATVTAGVHYIAFRQISGSSDAGDLGTFMGTVTPA